MKKLFITCLVFAVNISSTAAFSATGEYWEITSKMEMPGMPFAMPGTTSKVCLPPGGERDPDRTRDKKQNCEMTNVKTSGNKVSYKGTCTDQNGTMNMEGENTYERDSYSGIMHLTGKSHGRDMDMKMTSSGKRIGGSCDTEEAVKKAQAQGAEIKKEIKAQNDAMCDMSHYSIDSLVRTAMLADPRACPGKKEAFCERIRNEVPHDVTAFESLAQLERTRIQGAPSAVKACNVDLESMRKSICKDKAHSGPLSFLDANCPAEAKAYREYARKREDCSGRGYTSGEKFKKCMGGGAMSDEGDDEQKAPEKTNPADAVLEGAKKLKGFLHF